MTSGGILGGIVLVLCVHLSGGEATQANWKLGRSQGVWGFPDWRPDYARTPDYVVFSASVPGGPRRADADWMQQAAGEVVLGHVTSPIFQPTSPFWLDETTSSIKYGSRFAFEEIARHHQVPLDGSRVLPRRISLALKQSGASRGVLVNLSQAEQVQLLGSVSAPAAGMQDSKPEPSTKSAARSGKVQGGGWTNDPAARAVIEDRSVRLAAELYESHGYTVRQYGKPFDLLATGHGEVLHIEVKGTTGDGSRVPITENERLHAQDSGAGQCGLRANVPTQPCDRTDLVVVTDVTVDRSKSPLQASGGIVWRHEGWSAGSADVDKLLSPIRWDWQTNLGDPGWILETPVSGHSGGS